MDQHDDNNQETFYELKMDHGELLEWQCPSCGNKEHFSYEATVFVQPADNKKFYYDGLTHVIKNKVQCLSCNTSHTVQALSKTDIEPAEK